MRNFTFPCLRIDYGWKAPEVSDYRRAVQLGCDDKMRLRDNGVTLAATTQEFGVTRERVRQIKVKALAKCGKRCARNGYRLEDLVRYL